MKNIKYILLFAIVLGIIIFPKNAQAGTIHLTKADFDEAYEHRGHFIEGHDGEVWIDGHDEQGEWIEGHYETQWIEEHYEDGTAVKGIIAREEYDSSLNRYLVKYYMSSNTYTLDEDINFHSDANLVHIITMDGVTIELDLNHHVLKAGLYNHSAVEVSDSTLHIYGDGTIFGDECGVTAVNSTIVIDSGKFSDFKFDSCNVTINDGYFVNLYSARYYSGNSKIVINNGNFFSIYYGLLLVDQNVEMTINHGNFYGLYAGLEVLRNTKIDIHDANFYGLAYGALISTQASSFELEKAYFSIDEDLFMDHLFDKFGFMVTDEFPRSNLLALIEQHRGNICQPVGAVGIILGANSDLTLDSFVDENFVLSKDVTFETENMEYFTELYTTENTRIRYAKENEFSIISNYLVIDGANQTYKYKPITMRANGNYDIFEKIVVDGVEIDPKYYTSSRGSTIVTISNEYLSTLSSGVHNVSFVYVNGEATTNLTVPQTSNPKTGDNLFLYITLAVLSLIGLTGAGFYIKKKNFN